MEETNTNAAGYAGSEMRKYLSPIPGFESSSGCFYNGLVAAGIPAEVFYRPRRAVSGGTGIETIDDPVWLPAATEMNAFAINEAAGETAPSLREDEAQAAQPVFGYYTPGAILKYQISGSAQSYWTGSPDAQNRFIGCSHRSLASNSLYYFTSDFSASASAGTVPAFCVW
jgi:hypothetical protein